MLKKSAHLFATAFMAVAIASCGGESKPEAAEISDDDAVQLAGHTIAIEESLKKVEDLSNAIDEELKKLEAEQNETK